MWEVSGGILIVSGFDSGFGTLKVRWVCGLIHAQPTPTTLSTPNEGTYCTQEHYKCRLVSWYLEPLLAPGVLSTSLLFPSVNWNLDAP